METLKVSHVASEAGVSADTVRYYERIGLLPPPARSPAGYRLYDGEAVERLRFVKNAQRFGLSLDAIRELVEIRDGGMCPCGHTRRLLEERLAEIDREQEALAMLRADIERLLREAPRGDGAGCRPDLIQIERRTRP